MGAIRETDAGIKNMLLKKRPNCSFKGKTKNEIILLLSLKRAFFFKETVSLKTFDFPMRLQVSPSNCEGFPKGLFLKETRQAVLSNQCLRNDSTV